MAWDLTPEERQDTISRVSASIASLTFHEGTDLPADAALQLAQEVEQRAYTAAQVAARTTTGARPVEETTRAYARKLSELLLEAVRGAGSNDSGTQAPEETTDAQVLDLTGSRDFLTAEGAAKLLAPLLQPGAAFTKIKFSTKSFGADAAAAAAAALVNVAATLHTADLSDIIAGRPEDEALEALRRVCGALRTAKLRSLDLSDNALGEKGLRACAQALEGQSSLESLRLCNVGCSVHACAALAELLAEPSSLRSLSLFNNMSDSAGAVHVASVVARAPRLEQFRMASSRVSGAGGVALAAALAQGSCLTSLDLSDNPLGSRVAPKLAAAIALQPSLRVLQLGDTGLTDAGVAALCSALASAPASTLQSLEVMNLSLNEVRARGTAAVARLLLRTPKLQELVLRENELGDRGAALLVRSLPRLVHVRVLDLTACQLQDVAAAAIARGVAGCRALERLELDENWVSEVGVKVVRDILKGQGQVGVLGSMDENDPDLADEEYEEEEEEEEEEDIGSTLGDHTARLADELAALGL